MVLEPPETKVERLNPVAKKLADGWRFHYSHGFVWVSHPNGGAADVCRLDKRCCFRGDDMDTVGKSIAAMLNGDT